MAIFKKISQKVILRLVHLLVKEVKNDYYLPTNQGYIVASNHSSHIDPFIITSIIYFKRGRMARYIGKKESLNNIIWRFIYKTFDVIPIDRSSKSEKTLNYAVKCLKKKEIIGIFPEGTRTYDGNIQKGKTGVARMALQSDVCIVPIAIKGTSDLWPRQKKFPKIKRSIKVNIGKPIYLHDYQKKKISKRTLREITDSIMGRIEESYANT